MKGNYRWAFKAHSAGEKLKVLNVHNVRLKESGMFFDHVLNAFVAFCPLQWSGWNVVDNSDEPQVVKRCADELLCMSVSDGSCRRNNHHFMAIRTKIFGKLPAVLLGACFFERRIPVNEIKNVHVAAAVLGLVSINGLLGFRRP